MGAEGGEGVGGGIGDDAVGVSYLVPTLLPGNEGNRADPERREV